MCSTSIFCPGEAIFHPKYGFGAIAGLTRRNRLQPLRSATANAQPAPSADLTEEDYYDIHLMEGGTLLVPVEKAKSVGLRRLTNGLAAIEADLCSPSASLPDNPRERAAALRAGELTPEPEALTCTVRDVLARSRARGLSNGEKMWLDKSCQRLITEAALVDHISVAEARIAIWEIITQLRAPSA
jgi:RNA polymerase-interacting CarD/CdnL/TRCF family regulator